MQILRFSPIIAVLALAACSSSTNSDVALGPTLNRPNAALAQQPVVTPASVPATTGSTPGAAVAIADVGSYIDPTALARLGSSDKASAASAQFNALTFGRPGAPRAWQGGADISGSITVGPYVRVNNIDCRDFTHTVTVKGTPYAKKGTACRDPDGSWTVAG